MMLHFVNEFVHSIVINNHKFMLLVRENMHFSSFYLEPKGVQIRLLLVEYLSKEAVCRDVRHLLQGVDL